MSIDNVTAYINAGGRGTRIRPTLDDSKSDPVIGVSKAFLEVGHNKTLLIDHHIRRLLHEHIPTIIAGVGDHANVKSYVDQSYADHPNVYALDTAKQRGTAGDLIDALRGSRLFLGSILINNVDTILDIDDAAFMYLHREKDAGMTIALTRRKGVPNEGAFKVDQSDRVVYSAEASENPLTLQKAEEKMHWLGSSTGSVIIERELLQSFAEGRNLEEPLSLYRDVMAYALTQNALYAFDNKNKYFLDVGTVAAWEQAKADVEVIQSYLAD
ncbi:MAG TPA: sugar phosphate nucleotidyltransferase [Candidatus Saccharimonadales bacterium]|nr:sugar phosphate nucleotidyltransferase [Candidatus Saccharimonadales bacterium]